MKKLLVMVALLGLAVACQSSENTGQNNNPVGMGGSAAAAAGWQPVSGGINGASGAAGMITAGTTAPVAGMAGMPTAGTPATSGMDAPPPTGGMDALPPTGGTDMPPTGGTGGMVLPPSGPEDGDPSGPIVEAPGVPCGENPSLFGLTSTNVMIGGRAVHLAYPCNKHKGAPVIFILNLHGTMPTEDLKLYQVAYFSANNLVNSHNFITAAPKAIGSQWGNGDGGKDLPHIMEVIDWVYTTFADFDIRGMWLSGHSWGAMYVTNLVCDPTLQDKIKGAVIESGSGMNPACASRISVISTAAEMDIGPVINQGGIPAGHGCGAEQTNMVGNNVETYWPDCDAGFTHANYFMLGKMHATNIDAEVVERIGDLIKAARP